MKRAYLLLVLLGISIAEATQKISDKMIQKEQIKVSTIYNKTDKNWLFVLNNTTIKIPAQKNVLVNQTLSYFFYDLQTVAEIQLDPMPNKGFAKFDIFTKKYLKLDYTRQDKIGLFAFRGFHWKSLKSPAVNIQIMQKEEYPEWPGREINYYLTFQEA